MSKVFFNTPEDQVNFLTNVLNIKSESVGLDIGCGSGYHVQKLQNISSKIYGLDLKTPVLDISNFIQADIFESNLKFDGALDFAYALSPYFSEKWNNLNILLDKIYQYLKPEGKFILDLFNYNTRPIGHVKKDFELFDDRIILSSDTRNASSVTGEKKVIFKDWSQKLIPSYWKVFTKDELLSIATKSGFYISNEFGSFDTSSYEFANPRWTSNKSLLPQRLLVQFEKSE